MNVGLIGLSGKPIHLGHAQLIELAANECDEVLLFVSLSDRARPGEVPILGSDMARIWKEYIEPTLPINVRVTYGGSPIRNVWEALGKANETGSTDTFMIYGDPDDVSGNYPEASLQKYCRDIYASGQVKLRPVQRSATTNISGTEMRGFIAVSDRTSFVKNMPPQIDGNAIFDILSATAESKPQVKTTAPSRNAKR